LVLDNFLFLFLQSLDKLRGLVRPLLGVKHRLVLCLDFDLTKLQLLGSSLVSSGAWVHFSLIRIGIDLLHSLNEWALQLCSLLDERVALCLHQWLALDIFGFEILD